MTILFNSPIFGPVHSRRLGVSLGINLMPADGKICSFDCIYCECGLNGDHHTKSKRPTREEVCEGLTKVLRERHEKGEPLDVITFAGNGEPTGHPDFASIIDDTIAARDKYFPSAKVSCSPPTPPSIGYAHNHPSEQSSRSAFPACSSPPPWHCWQDNR